MTDLTLIDAIESAMSRVRERIAAAIVAGDDTECGRIIREEVNARLADWRELERPSEVSDEELAQAFRDVYAAQAAMDRAEDATWKLAEDAAEIRAIYREKQRDDAREQWAEMTAEVRAHEAGE